MKKVGTNSSRTSEHDFTARVHNRFRHRGASRVFSRGFAASDRRAC